MFCAKKYWCTLMVPGDIILCVVKISIKISLVNINFDNDRKECVLKSELTMKGPR